MGKSRGDNRGRYQPVNIAMLDATPPPRQPTGQHASAQFHHGSISSADSNSLNHYAGSSHPTSPLLASHRSPAVNQRRAGRIPVNTVVNERGLVSLQNINDTASEQPVYHEPFQNYGPVKSSNSHSHSPSSEEAAVGMVASGGNSQNGGDGASSGSSAERRAAKRHEEDQEPKLHLIRKGRII